MQYYHDLIMQKSFEYLQALKKQYDFVLIGGWAVFLYSRALKSKDIDIIVDYATLGRMKEASDIFKNDRLKKYEIKTGEFDVDIYLPHYSDLGIDVEEIKKLSIVREGFLVPPAEVLLLLKIYAFKERRGSTKGQKDELDIFSLAALPEFDWVGYKNLVADFNLAAHNELFLELLKKTRSVEELGLNEQKFARLRKLILSKI